MNDRRQPPGRVIVPGPELLAERSHVLLERKVILPRLRLNHVAEQVAEEVDIVRQCPRCSRPC